MNDEMHHARLRAREPSARPAHEANTMPRRAGGADRRPRPDAAPSAWKAWSTRNTGKETPMTIVVSSPAFGDGGEIPQRFTCDGADVSPPLRFAGSPVNTAELALLVEDPDAPG